MQTTPETETGPGDLCSHTFSVLLLPVQQHAAVLRAQVQSRRGKVHREDADWHWRHEGPGDDEWGLPSHFPGVREGEDTGAPGQVYFKQKYHTQSMLVQLGVKLINSNSGFTFSSSAQSRTRQAGSRYAQHVHVFIFNQYVLKECNVLWHVLQCFGSGFPGDHRDLPAEKWVIQECTERSRGSVGKCRATVFPLAANTVSL